MLVCGEDEFQVKRRGREVFDQWCGESADTEQECLDAQVTNSGDALAALARLREALNTLPFFGSSKVIWLQNCTFLGDDRTASSQGVTAALTDLAHDFKTAAWQNVRLLITSGKVDKRKTLYKTIDKLGKVEQFAGMSVEDRDWLSEAEGLARDHAKSLGKSFDGESAARLANWVGPNTRSLIQETEKVALYCGDRARISVEDVDTIVTRNKHSRAFALADALGGRNLPHLLRVLDEELWEIRGSSQRSEIGLLYGLISKVRTMLFLKELIRTRAVHPDSDFNRFKTQLARVPAETLPSDKRFNPLSLNPYVLFKALPHAANYSFTELIQAMERLLNCNRRLIFSGLEAALVLQQTLVQIVIGESQPAHHANPER
jgi:DNA polymerase III subunit delta